MKISLYISTIVFVLLSACTVNDSKIVPDKVVINPILKMEVVEIPSEGLVTWISGEADIKKKGQSEYSRIVIETVVGENDIIWLKKGSEVKISFEDGSYVLNEPPTKDVFITFDMKNTKNVPK